MTDIRDRQKVSKVNTPPIGLQSLLGNVNQGINPHELNHQIQPITDLFPHWSTNKTVMDSVQDNAVAAIPGNGVELIVPEGEVWVPISMSGYTIPIAAGRSMAVSVGIVDRTNTRFTGLARAETVDSVNVSQRIRATFAFPMRFILPPGFGLRCEFDYAQFTTDKVVRLDALYIVIRD